MTSNSLTENEEQDIPSHILKTIFGLHDLVIFRPKYVWFPVHLKGLVIPDPSGQLAELIVYTTSTRVDLYSHQMLFWEYVRCKYNPHPNFDCCKINCQAPCHIIKNSQVHHTAIYHSGNLPNKLNHCHAEFIIRNV